MADVDQVSGLPKSMVEKVDKSEKLLRLDANKAASEQLLSDIASPSGQVIIHRIQSQLLNRINQLMAEDAECNTLKKLLVGMGVTINMGEKAVTDLLRLLEKK